MNKKALVVVFGLLVILGGLVYAKMRIGNDVREGVGVREEEQEQSGEVVRKNDGGMQAEEEVSEEDLDKELESVSQEIDQVINDLSDELVEPDVNLDL